MSEPVQMHNVEDVVALARAALSEQLKAWNATLRHAEFEDALSYLVLVTCELSRRYDPAKGVPSFSSYATRILRLRLTDWYRKRFYDSRYGPERHDVSLDATSGGSRLDATLGSGALDPHERSCPDLGRALAKGNSIGSRIPDAPDRALDEGATSRDRDADELERVAA